MPPKTPSADSKEAPKIEPVPLSPQEVQKREKQLAEAAEYAQKAHLSQAAAAEAQQRADEADDDTIKEKALEEVEKHEKTANEHIEKAKVIESGALQGAFAGAGIGAATGMGLGTALGTVVGGVTAIPLTGLGALVGAGSGAIHGPWLKMPRFKDENGDKVGGEDNKATREKEKDMKDYEKGLKPLKNRLAGEVSNYTPFWPWSPLKAVMNKIPPSPQPSKKSPPKPDVPQSGQPAPRKQPRKLEIRSGKNQEAAS
ncbi:glycoside hydrolase family protein [Venturia nashicola]|uniref:Glycoside hydrolase family 31 protein n=1 Tax=Venturia nashicola TaxID=86259 RepID=A0A4Z1PA56_9PEZI|nr:glycoside hydrolase family 31 protein [Venturia nashicola]TLD38179.1 glycoside hydrolase family protein [Venturia nashicola]